MDDKTRGVGDERTRGFVDDEVTPVTPTTSTARSTAARSRATSAASKVSAGASTDLDPDTERRTREIQSEIQHTREEMAETVEALQEKLRPSNVIADATERVKHATTSKVRSMAETASDTAQGMMRQTRYRASDVVEGARQNPIPALMIGAGVAWLLMDKSKNRSQSSWYQGSRGSSGYSSAAFRSGEYYPDETEPAYSDVDYGTTGSRSQTYMRNDASASVADRARSAAQGQYEAVRRTTYQAQNQLQRVLRDNPLLVGAAAVVIGAAVGAALPETERENELMGETRDSVVNRAQDAARNAASAVQEVAKDAANQVADRVTSGGTD
jgi:ElaB/YqjD/DUF883 family membrane-anchored ribosome-binding protein